MLKQTQLQTIITYFQHYLCYTVYSQIFDHEAHMTHKYYIDHMYIQHIPSIKLSNDRMAVNMQNKLSRYQWLCGINNCMKSDPQLQPLYCTKQLCVARWEIMFMGQQQKLQLLFSVCVFSVWQIYVWLCNFQLAPLITVTSWQVFLVP